MLAQIASMRVWFWNKIKEEHNATAIKRDTHDDVGSDIFQRKMAMKHTHTYIHKHSSCDTYGRHAFWCQRLHGFFFRASFICSNGNSPQTQGHAPTIGLAHEPTVKIGK